MTLAHTPLGAATTVGKYQVDVNTGTFAAPVWVPVRGCFDFAPNLTPGLQDDTDFDSSGFGSQTVTKLNWDLQFTVTRKEDNVSSTVYDAGQEFLRTTAEKVGPNNIVDVRWYEYNPQGGPLVEAYRGFAAVSWSPKGGQMDALDQVGVTLTGKGKRTPITHPALSSTLPVINALAPNTAPTAGGEYVEIQGAYLGTATAVKVNGVSLASAAWGVVNDGVIGFVAPAESAGAQAVTVVTPAGTSNAVNLTYS